MKNVVLLAYKDAPLSFVCAGAIASLLDPDAYNAAVCVIEPLARKRSRGLFHLLTGSFLLWHLTNNRLVCHYAAKVLDTYAQVPIDLEKYAPDMIISLHPVADTVAAKYAADFPVNIIHFIVTPFRIHSLWRRSQGTYSVPFAQMQMQLLHHRVRADVLTYPVHKIFLESTTKNPKEIFALLSLQEQYTVCVFVRSMQDVVKVLQAPVLSGMNCIFICPEVLHKKLIANQTVASLKGVTVVRDDDLALVAAVLAISDVCLMPMFLPYVLQSLAADTIPFIYTHRLLDWRMVRLLKQAKCAKIGGWNKLLVSVRLSADRRERYRKEGNLFLQTYHILSAKKLFNEYTKSHFPE